MSGVAEHNILVIIDFRVGSTTVLAAPKRHFRSATINGHRQTGPVGPVGAITRQSTPMKPSRNLVLETGALQ
jgi:hypothetical protein